MELPESGGNTVIWTVVDLFSKQAHFIPCQKLPSVRVLAKMFVQHIYRLHGVPKWIISDQLWQEFWNLIGSPQVRWKGYPVVDAEWVAARDIRVARLVKRFHYRYHKQLK